jgi:hypothetical protein
MESPMTSNTQNSITEDLTPATGTIDIESLLDNIEVFILKHTVLPRGTSTAITLWCLSTYLINQFRIYPKLIITSPEKRCGKSTLLDLIEAFTFKATITSNLSTAVIYRLIEETQPTLIMDEADTFVAGSSSDMTGIINSGHAQNRAFVYRCGEKDFKPMKFSTWAPMVLASIGQLQPTTMDRGIVVQLIRKSEKETVQRIRVDLFEKAKHTRQELLKWALDHAEIIKRELVEPPNIGNDRAVDNWLPLFTISKKVSEKWHTKCEQAYELLERDTKEPELSTLLLQDISTILGAHATDKISSSELVSILALDKDKPWCELKNGRPITQHKMAEILKPYGIKPSTIRIGSTTLRGYSQSQFTETFDRYL